MNGVHGSIRNSLLIDHTDFLAGPDGQKTADEPEKTEIRRLFILLKITVIILLADSSSLCIDGRLVNMPEQIVDIDLWGRYPCAQ